MRAMDDLVFHFQFSPVEIQNMAVSEILYWHNRAAAHNERQKEGM
jgi:hypothetical protein